MRIFLAVFPPPAVQAAAAAAIEGLRRPHDGVSWVKPDNLHYTLRFLGEIGADGLGRAGQAAHEAARKSRAFDAALGALGAFPNPRRARVIWAGMSEGAAPLEALARDLETELERRGFEREGRGFSAHLTLGRVREPGHDWTSDLAGATVAAGARFVVDRLLVVESQLDPRGSIYTTRVEEILQQ